MYGPPILTTPVNSGYRLEGCTLGRPTTMAAADGWLDVVILSDDDDDAMDCNRGGSGTAHDRAACLSTQPTINLCDDEEAEEAAEEGVKNHDAGATAGARGAADADGAASWMSGHVGDAVGASAVDAYAHGAIVDTATGGNEEKSAPPQSYPSTTVSAVFGRPGTDGRCSFGLLADECELGVYGADIEGRRVDIYWSGDRKWFGGVVAKFYPNPGGPWSQHRIQYDDGSDKRHTLHFSLTRWRLSTGTEPTWVQCGLCSKWRRLPQSAVPPDEDEEWDCSMNPDVEYRSCAAPQQADTESDDDASPPAAALGALGDGLYALRADRAARPSLCHPHPHACPVTFILSLSPPTQR